jgi:outer membrane receptor protein involved in Fe transport
VADGLWTHLNDPQIGYNESYYFPYGFDQNNNPEWTNIAMKNGLVTGLTAADFQPEMVNNTTNRVVTTSVFGLNAEWKPVERLSITGFDLYRSTANRPEGGEDTFVTAGLVTTGPYPIDTLNFTDVPNSLPNINVAIPPSQLGLSACPSGTASSTNPGSCSYTALMNKGLLNNNNYWSTHYVGLNGYSVHDQVTGFTLDGVYDADAGWFDKFLFGAGLSQRDKSRYDSSNDWTNGSGQYGTLYNTAGCPVQCTPYSFGSQGFNVVSMVSPPNFMQGAGGSYPVVLPQLNAGQLIAFLKSLNGKPNPFFCSSLPCSTPFDFAQTLPQVNPYNSYDVTERSISAYGELTFKGTNWSGNIGLRLVRTNTTASTAEAVPDSLWTPSTVGSTQTWNVQYATLQPVDTTGSYLLPLPSANFSYWAIPSELQLRAALAETMSRPDLNEMAPTSTNNAINGQPQLYYGGTAGLKPIKAAQIDFSAEWYYQPHSALTLALFGKKDSRRYLFGHSNQRQSGNAAVRRWTARHRPRHALLVDGPGTGKRRQERLLRRRTRVATHHGKRLRRHDAVHTHREQELRPERQQHRCHQCRAADDDFGRSALRERPHQRRRQQAAAARLAACARCASSTASLLRIMRAPASPLARRSLASASSAWALRTAAVRRPSMHERSRSNRAATHILLGNAADSAASVRARQHDVDSFSYRSHRPTMMLASVSPYSAVAAAAQHPGIAVDLGRWPANSTASVRCRRRWDYAASFQYYCSQCTEVPGWPAISDSFQWLTASLHYKFTKQFQVYAEGKNLTDAIARTYLNGNPLLPWAPGQNVGQSFSGVGAGYSSYGRTLTVGASFQF